MADEPLTTDTTVDDVSSAAAQDAKLNAVVKSHIRRELKAMQEQLGALKNIDQTIAASIAKALESKGDVPQPKGTKGEDKGDPQVKLLMEKHEQLARELKEERDRRVALETTAKKNGVRDQMKAALEAKGIKGAKAAALISYFENSAVRESEDGAVMFASARSRAKGAPVEELEFDIATGIEDWCKTPEAAEFLPAPSAKPPTDPNRPAARPVLNRRPETRNGSVTEISEAEAVRRTAAMLEQKGINLNAILDE